MVSTQAMAAQEVLQLADCRGVRGSSHATDFRPGSGAEDNLRRWEAIGHRLRKPRMLQARPGVGVRLAVGDRNYVVP